MAKAKQTDNVQLTATRRWGQRARAKELRMQGVVPGVVYGKAIEPVAIAVSAKALNQALRTRAGEHALVTLRIEPDGAGAATWERVVLVKDVQHDPIDGRLMHVDFHAVVLTERLKVKVPVELTGTPVGVKEGGGILEHFLREVEVECLPTNIPLAIDYDISGLQMGQTVHVSDLTAPEGTKITSDPEGAIAAVQQPKEEKPEAEAAVTEPEVITEKKAEAEEGAAAEAEGKKEAPEKKSPEKKSKE